MNKKSVAGALVGMSRRCGSGDGVCIRTSDDAKMFLWGRGVFAKEISLVTISSDQRAYYAWMAVDVSEKNLVPVFDGSICAIDRACTVEKVVFDSQVMPWNGRSYIARHNDKGQIEVLYVA